MLGSGSEISGSLISGSGASGLGSGSPTGSGYPGVGSAVFGSGVSGSKGSGSGISGSLLAPGIEVVAGIPVGSPILRVILWLPLISMVIIPLFPWLSRLIIKWVALISYPFLMLSSLLLKKLRM